MEKIQKQFKEATKSVVLTEEEKAGMRDMLVQYMEYKPIRGSASQSNTKESAFLKKLSFPYFRSHHFTGAMLIAAMVASSSFGVSFAADEALPGDLLYNIKVNINEEIKSALLSTDESRISWERERAERRLVEASKLESEGRFDVAKKEKVSKLFAEHTRAMVEQVRAVEESDPVLVAEMSSMFEDSLDAHEAVLARLIVEQESTTDKSARELVAQVRSVSMEVEKIRNNAEEKIAIDEGEMAIATEDQSEVVEEEISNPKTESANLRVRAAYRAQERAVNLLAEVKKVQATLDPESELAQHAQVQVAFGEALVLEGEMSLENNNLGEAYGKYRKASASLQKVLQLVEIATLFSVEIYPDKDEVEEVDEFGVSVKTVETEEDEKILQLNTIRADVEGEIDTARMLLLTQTGHDEVLVQKVNNRMKDALSHLLRGEIAMVLKDYSDAEVLFRQAQKLTSAVVQTLEQAAQEDEVNEVPVIEVPEDEDIEAPAEPRFEEPTQADTQVLKHQFSNGVHTYSGSMTLPTPCHTLEHTYLVAESFPEQISIEFSVNAPDPDVMCIQVVQDAEFTVEVQASEQAKLSAVRKNGVEQKWKIER